MSDDTNAVLALKNAWTGAVQTSDELKQLAPTLDGLPDSATVADLDLEVLHRASLAHANAAQAVRGLVEQLQRKAEAGG